MNDSESSTTLPPPSEPPENDPRGLVLWYARSELGQENPYSYWLDALGELPDGHRAWCGIFALWCLRQAGLTDWHWQTGKGFASRLRMTSSPMPGDIAYFDKPYQHHALVTKSEGDLVYLIQGNYGSPGRVALSVVSRKQKHPVFYSIAELLPRPKPQPATPPTEVA